MKRFIVCAAWLACTVSACGSQDDPPGGVDPTTDPTVKDGSTLGSVDSTVDDLDGGVLAHGDASDDSTTDSGPVVPSIPAALCDSAQMWGAGAKLAISTVSDDLLPAVTSDERTIAWITPDNAVHYADRDDAANPFGAAQLLPTVGLALGERVGITFDGLTLYAIRADRHGLVAFSRASRSDPFTTYGTQTLENINAEGAALGVGDAFSDLVVTNSVLLVRVTNGASAGIRLSARVLPGDSWPFTSAFAAQSQLASVGAQARRPTGLSTDRRALFYFDEVSGKQSVALFAYDSNVANTFVDLGARIGAQPNASCTSLYYSATGDLFVAAKP